MKASECSQDLHQNDIEDYLKQYIQKNHLCPGDRMPSENELAACLYANRNTVRAALTSLKYQGLLYSQQGKGFYVADTPKTMEFRLIPELGLPECLKKTDSTHSVRLLKQEKRVCTQQEASLLNICLNSQVCILHQLWQTDSVNMAVCISVIPEKWVPGLESHMESFQGTRDLLTRVYQIPQPVVASRLLVKASLPTLQEQMLLNVPQYVPVLQQEILYCMANVAPVEYLTIRTRGDNFTLSVALK